jgi:hypothetical protein
MADLKLTPSTYFALMAEFGTAHVPVTIIGKKYFGYSEIVAKNNATRNKYPFLVFRAGGDKSIWLTDIVDVAAYIDKVKEKAKLEYNTAN